MSTRLHVGNIPSTVVESDLATTFGKFGEVDFVDIARDSFQLHSVPGLTTGVSRSRDGGK